MEDNTTEESSQTAEPEENEIEVSVQISDSSGTLDNRYSFVILDVKEEPDDITSARGRKNTREKLEITKSSAPIQEANEKDLVEINLNDNGREHDVKEKKKSVIICEGSKVDAAAKEPERWKENLVLPRVHCLYINYSVWGSLHFLTRLINLAVLSRNGVGPDAVTIIFTAAISLLVYINVWACFTLERTVTYRWFKASLCLSCGSGLICLVYLVVTVVQVSAIDRWTFFMGLSMCFVMGTLFALLMTSIAAFVLLTFAALRKTNKSNETSEEIGTAEQAQAETARHAVEDFNTVSAFQCVIVLFLSGTLTAMTGVALAAIDPCSVIWLYAMSVVFVSLPLIVIGVRNHMKKEKSKFLWLAFLWVSALALLLSSLTFVFVIVDLARTGGSCSRSKVISIILDLVLLFATLMDTIILIRMLWLATLPYRKKTDPPPKGDNNGTSDTTGRTTEDRPQVMPGTDVARIKRLNSGSHKTM